MMQIIGGVLLVVILGGLGIWLTLLLPMDEYRIEEPPKRKPHVWRRDDWWYCMDKATFGA